MMAIVQAFFIFSILSLSLSPPPPPPPPLRHLFIRVVFDGHFAVGLLDVLC
jgi:hypothetical protein